MEAQINYYESLGVSFANFVGKWKDNFGINGLGGGHFYGGDIEIFADGSASLNNGAGTSTAWWNGWNEIDIHELGGNHHYGKLVDGYIRVTRPTDGATWILERAPEVPIVTGPQYEFVVHEGRNLNWH